MTQAELMLDAPETHEEPSQVMGFEFLVREPQGERWVQLQGYGGTLGAGFLYLFDKRGFVGDDLPSIYRDLLARARYELQSTGQVREYRDVPDYRERIRPIEALEVLDVRGPA